MTRISTQMQHTLTLNTTQRAKGELQRLQTELSTGTKAQKFSDISSKASSFINLETQIDKSQAFIDNINMAQRHLKLTQQGLESVHDFARQFDKYVKDKLDINSAEGLNNQQLAKEARNYLNQIVDILNTKDESRYIFGGTNFDEKPVTTDGYTSPDGMDNGTAYNTAANEDYYKGSQNKSSIRLSDSFEKTYGITANHPAIEKIIRSMDHLAQLSENDHYTFTDPVDGPPAPSQKQNLEALSKDLVDGIRGLKQLMVEVSLDDKNMENAKGNHENMKNYAETKQTDIDEVDTGETIIEMQQHQTTLEASYRLISRLKDLTLMDYI